MRKPTVQAAPAIPTAIMGHFVTLTSGGFVTLTFVLAWRKASVNLEITVYSGDEV